MTRSKQVAENMTAHFAGGRLSNQPTSAKEQRYYSDPAKHVKFVSEKCSDCKYERIIIAGKDIGIGVCMKKNKDGSKRLYGTRCDEYREKGTK